MKPHRMPRGGIGQRTLFRFAIPLLIVILLLGYTVTVLYLSDHRYAMEERGNLLARHLAVLSEFSVFAGDRDTLQKYVDSILQEPDVLYVAIEDSNHGILARAGRPASEAAEDELVHFSAPIVSSGVDVSDYEEPDTLDNTAADTAGTRTAHVSLSRDTMHTRESDILAVGIIATTIALLASLLLAFSVSRSVSEPIERLTATVNMLTDGKLSVRTSESSPGELGTLEHGINQMASTLEDAQNQLRKEVEEATEALQTTVHKLEKRNADLDQARSDAIKAGSAKSEFLARMSHEIRTPLSAIIGFSGLLKKTGLSDSQREYILTITQAASQLLQIIDDILGYTRLDSNTLPIESGEFNLYETLENVVSILSVLAHEKHLELVLYIHSDVPQYISSDPNRISQVLTNLINNAIKFTDKGHVVVEVSALDSDSDTVTINFAVTDTGIGMSEAQLSQVFDPFIQADVSISREYGGTGLGLSISKKLVDLLGGEIDVSSQPGKGTTFSFTITTPFEITEKDSERRPLTGNKVLVYDCNPFSLRALRNRFLTLGATVFNTSNRARLLEMIAANKQCDSHCDLLVMGLSLEEYDGIAHDAWLDDVRRSCDTPALVLIGDELHDQPTCLEQERMCILSKPPRSDRLLRQVRKMLSLAQGTSAATDTEIPGPGIPEDHVCLNILVAEDNRFNQQLFSELLGNLGAHVSLASNGKEACELAEHRLFDLVFMDIHMPVMGGVKATQQIRNGKNRLTPVVALTADVFVDSEQQLRSLGLDDILYKPVSEQKLVNMLDRWCKPRLPDTGTGKRDTAALPPAFQKRLQRELGRQLNTLRKAIDSDNQELFADHMHQLKGLVQYFGLKEFTDGFGLLEKAHDTGAIHAAMDTLEALLMQMVADTRAT